MPLPPELAALLPTRYRPLSDDALITLGQSELLAFAEGVRRLVLEEAFRYEGTQSLWDSLADEPRWSEG